MEYILLHKNIEVCLFDIDNDKNIKCLDLYNKEHLPIGNFNNEELKTWLENRAIPMSRLSEQDLLKEFNLKNQIDLIIKSNGASLSDQYWVKEKENIIKWENVNFFNNHFDYSLYDLYISSVKTLDPFPKNRYTNEQLNNANNNLNGEMPKAWIIHNGKRCLLKGQKDDIQIYNEVIISKLLDDLGVKHIKYNIVNEDGNKNRHSICENYITEDTELISGLNYMLMENFDVDKNINSNVLGIKYLIDIWEQCGIKDTKKYFTQMMGLDYIFANADRHYNNFGIVRDANSLQLIEIFPIFDNGNTLWYQAVKNSNLDFIGKQVNCRMDYINNDWYNLFSSCEIKSFENIFDFNKLEEIPEKIKQYYIYFKEKYNLNIGYSSIENISLSVKNNIEKLKDYGKGNTKKFNVSFKEDDIDINNQNLNK